MFSPFWPSKPARREDAKIFWVDLIHFTSQVLSEYVQNLTFLNYHVNIAPGFVGRCGWCNIYGGR